MHSRIEHLEDSLRRVEERLARLEDAPGQTSRRQTEPLEAPEASTTETPYAALAGRAVLIVGGAYVLRALTEREVIDEMTGAVLGLLYGLGWVYSAGRAMHRALERRALVEAATAALIVSALLWETATQFRIIPLPAASVVASVFALAIAAVAYRHKSPRLMIVATLMCCVTSIGLAISGADAVVPLVSLSVFGVIIAFLECPFQMRWLVAGAADTLAIAVIVLSLFQGTQTGAEWTLIAYAALWLIPREPIQSVIAVTLGVGGAALIAGTHSGPSQAVATAALVVALTAYAFGFVRRTNGLGGPVAIAIATVVLISLPATVVSWAVLLVLSAAAARIVSWSALDLHVLFWAIAAFAGGAAIVRSSTAPAAVFIAAVVALVLTDPAWTRTRSILLLTATGSFLAIAILSTGTPVIRTLVIAAAAVLLSMLRSVLPEGRMVARILLIIGGVKLLIDDLRVGTAAASLMALMIYGVALLVAARINAGDAVSGSNRAVK